MTNRTRIATGRITSMADRIIANKILFADGVLILLCRLFQLRRFVPLLLVAHRAVYSLLEQHRLTPSPQACGGRRRSGSGEPLPTPERPACRSPCSICSAYGTCSPSAGSPGWGCRPQGSTAPSRRRYPWSGWRSAAPRCTDGWGDGRSRQPLPARPWCRGT